MKVNDELSQSIIKIVAFFDVFNYPVSLTELKKYLLYCQLNVPEDIVKHISPQKIIVNQGYCFFKDRNNLMEKKMESAKIAATYWQKVDKIRPWLAMIPYLKMVAVCNNLALNTVDKDSDIDLFIITRKNRLFTARLLVTAIIQLLGQRRYGSKISGRFCLSFYVTENYLNLEQIQIKPQDIYLAYWLKSLEPIIDDGIYKKFTKSNESWLKNYFYNPSQKTLKYLISPSFFQKSVKKIQESILNSFVGEILEKFLKKWQKNRARQKMANLGPEASIIITDDVLKFHNLDRRRKIYEKWRKIVDEYTS